MHHLPLYFPNKPPIPFNPRATPWATPLENLQLHIEAHALNLLYP